MTKTKLCKICKRRRVRQQVWKDEREKETCLSCNAFMKNCSGYIKALEMLALKQGIACEIDLKINNIKQILNY